MSFCKEASSVRRAPWMLQVVYVGCASIPVQRDSVGFCRAVGCSRELAGKPSGNCAEESVATGTEMPTCKKASCLGIFLLVNMTVVPSEPVWDPNWECTAAEVPGSAVNAGEWRSRSPLLVCVGCCTPNVARVEGISLFELFVSECTQDVCFLPCCQHASFNTSVSAVSP